MATSPDAATAAGVPYRPHTGPARQYIRDIILGVNDGLVSIFLLVVGVVGGDPVKAGLENVAVAAGAAVGYGVGTLFGATIS